MNRYFAIVVTLSFAWLLAMSTVQIFDPIVSPAYAKDGESKDSASKDSKSKASEDEKKVVICHAPPGNPDNAQTISVAESAVAAHLEHGDSLGACYSCVCPPNVSSCTCPDGTPGSPGPASTAAPGPQRQIQGQ